MTFKRYKSGDRRISAGDMNARADAIEGLMQSGGPGSIIDGSGYHTRRIVGEEDTPPIFARITAYNGTTRFYTAVGIEPTNTGDNTPGAGYADISPAVTYTGCFERRGFIGIEIGAKVEIVPAGTWAGSAAVLPVGTALYAFQFVLPGIDFKVKVEKTGGAAGPISTWTYTVTSVDGHAIATAKPQELRRPAGVATTFSPAGTIGKGYYDAAGTFHLYDANETC